MVTVATWPFWMFFFVVAIGAILLAKRLDDRDRRIYGGTRRRRSPGPSKTRIPRTPRAPRADETTERFPTQKA